MKDDYLNYRLIEARKNAGYSSNDLAEKSGLSLQTIYHYEIVHMFPQKIHAKRLAQVLDVPEDYIFPGSLREITTEVRRERRSKQAEFEASFLPMSMVGCKDVPSVLEDTVLETNEELEYLTRSLRPVQKDVLTLRYAVHPLGYLEIGQIIGKTRQATWALAASALTKIRKENGLGDPNYNEMTPYVECIADRLDLNRSVRSAALKILDVLDLEMLDFHDKSVAVASAVYAGTQIEGFNRSVSIVANAAIVSKHDVSKYLVRLPTLLLCKTVWNKGAMELLGNTKAK